jgi:predicted O-methyltransferase YrrM
MFRAVDERSMSSSAPATVPSPAQPTQRLGFTFVSSTEASLLAQPERLCTALTAHADQKPRERVLLYALVFALAPQRVLEIGVRWGGGTRIIRAALADVGRGRIISIDPAPALEYPWENVSDLATLITGASPQALPRAREAAGGAFDFVFIDGDHSYDAALADLQGCIDITAPGAVILLHDAYHPPVQRAIDKVLSLSNAYVDCGLLATTCNQGHRAETGATVTYGGVRMLRRAG